MQVLLRGDRPARVVGEHHGVARVRGLRGAHGQCAGVAAQVVGVLDDVVPERLARQRAVGQPGDERVGEDRRVDVVDVRPEQVAGAVRARCVHGGHGRDGSGDRTTRSAHVTGTTAVFVE